MKLSRAARPDASGGLRSDPDLASELLDDMPALLWTTDKRLRLTGSIGGAMHSLGLPSNGIRDLSVTEFFRCVEGDPELYAAHRRALAGETAACVFRSDRGSFRGLLKPIRRSGRIAGVVGVALQDDVEHPGGRSLGRLVDLSRMEAHLTSGR